MPDSRNVDPQVQRELDAIDAALAGWPVPADGAHGAGAGGGAHSASGGEGAHGASAGDGAPDGGARDVRGADFAALALALRDERPQMPPTSAARLDRRVSATLSAPSANASGRESSSRGRGTSFFGRAPKFAFAAALASLLIVSVIAVPVFNGSQSGRIGGSSLQGDREELQAGDSPAAGRADEQSASAEQESEVPQGTGTTVDPRNALPANGDPGSRRLVERSAGITLAAPQRELQQVADRVIRTTDSLDGFVQASTVSSGPDGADGGYFELRVPAPRLARALSQLSQLASVRQRSQNSQDITAERASEASRLADARAERKSVLRRLARANTDSEAAMLRSRARRLSVRIAGLRRAVRRVDQRAAYATIVVNLVDERSSLDGSATDGRFTPADALRTAGQILAFMASATLVVLAVALPMGLAFMVLVWLSRALRRQQRDQALDSA